ncbi:tRNA (guanosine(46)-N7)-methyltransferase TrmB [Synechococcus sp. PCC 6312]|uniref:tRNA (guanosine(46)-N7)-methyltransferase TrmB n=1 Tax=Synechococcus sp. (strain ATCC 27167 / PCC 6312) TaxID=195253 RepID=UPI00029F1243|nr:tRNA (guanosine(46)-N7)-methyltransferase TrmB [Synechococcus sp. PCC 6312]AFY59604.1 tRNA (guanine-N(7)-)-methyltransferase [Synechococcus sp. PCC 6312]
MPYIRTRQHVNPLSRQFQTPIETPAWETVFAHPDQPLHLDIGCARGRFVLEMAEICPNWNFMGLEIRKVLVDEANGIAQARGLGNLSYLFANANVSLSQVFAPATVDLVTIQFPDPWFKRRHQKRRLVQPELVAALAQIIKPGGFVFLQSDVLEVAVQMRETFAEHSLFKVGCPARYGLGEICSDLEQGRWLGENPLPVKTEREKRVEFYQLPIYRCGFLRQEVEN